MSATKTISTTHACPRCNGAIERTGRRRIDHLVSSFVPILRFRCIAPLCGWAGNVKRTAMGGAASRQRARRPTAILVSTLLALGIAGLVIFLGATDFLSLHGAGPGAQAAPRTVTAGSTPQNTALRVTMPR